MVIQESFFGLYNNINSDVLIKNIVVSIASANITFQVFHHVSHISKWVKVLFSMLQDRHLIEPYKSSLRTLKVSKTGSCSYSNLMRLNKTWHYGQRIFLLLIKINTMRKYCQAWNADT